MRWKTQLSGQRPRIALSLRSCTSSLPLMSSTFVCVASTPFSRHRLFIMLSKSQRCHNLQTNTHKSLPHHVHTVKLRTALPQLAMSAKCFWNPYLIDSLLLCCNTERMYELQIWCKSLIQTQEAVWDCRYSRQGGNSSCISCCRHSSYGGCQSGKQKEVCSGGCGALELDCCSRRPHGARWLACRRHQRSLRGKLCRAGWS